MRAKLDTVAAGGCSAEWLQPDLSPPHVNVPRDGSCDLADVAQITSLEAFWPGRVERCRLPVSGREAPGYLQAAANIRKSDPVAHMNQVRMAYAWHAAA